MVIILIRNRGRKDSSDQNTTLPKRHQGSTDLETTLTIKAPTLNPKVLGRRFLGDLEMSKQLFPTAVGDGPPSLFTMEYLRLLSMRKVCLVLSREWENGSL